MDFATFSALVGTKRKSNDVPMEVSAPRRLKTTHPDVINKITTAYEEIATSFPHFQVLPPELQIDIWKHAIKNAIGDDNMKAAGFGINILTTEKLISHRVGKFKYKLITGPNGPTSLMVPKFRHIMGTNSFARIEALKWWKKIYEECRVGGSLTTTLVTNVSRLIEDVLPTEAEEVEEVAQIEEAEEEDGASL